MTCNKITDGTQTDDTIYRSYAETLKMGVKKDNSDPVVDRVVKEPPILHSLLQKCKEIRVKFTDPELVKQCGNNVIEGGSEYFRKCRRIIYRFVKAWEERIHAPFDLKTGKHYDEMSDSLADLIEGVMNEDREVRRKLLAKAYRSVSMSAEHVHMFKHCIKGVHMRADAIEAKRMRLYSNINERIETSTNKYNASDSKFEEYS